MSSPVAKAARRVTHELHGVVVSAGLMDKTVKVRVGGQKWNKIVNKVCLYAMDAPCEASLTVEIVLPRPETLSRP
jgi:hypothetical protein